MNENPNKMKNLVSTTQVARELKAKMDTTHLDKILATQTNNPQIKFQAEKNLYKADLLEMLNPIETEILKLGTVLSSDEHDAMQSVIMLLRSGHAGEVKQALAPIIGLAIELQEKNEVISEVGEIIENRYSKSVREDGTHEEMTLEDEMILKVELIGNILPD